MSICRKLAALILSSAFVANADLDQWQFQNPGAGSGVLYALGYGAGQWLAGGLAGDGYLTSPNGLSWTARNTLNGFLGVNYGDGLWVAVGMNGSIHSSPDGLSWTLRNPVATNAFLYAVSFANHWWVIVGWKIILTSPDGITWTERDSHGAMLRSVAFGNGLWVAVGIDGALLTSNDGMNWIPGNSGTTANLNGIHCGNGQWVAVGGGLDPQGFSTTSGIILSSNDASSWTVRNSSTSIRYGFSAVAYGNGRWVALRQQSAPGGGNAMGSIMISTNAISWVEQSLGSPAGFFGAPGLAAVAYANGLWVAVGGRGSIATSGRVVGQPRMSITRSGSNALVAWPADSSGFILEATPNLATPLNWKVITTPPSILNSQNTVTEMISGPARFYRLRQP